MQVHSKQVALPLPNSLSHSGLNFKLKNFFAMALIAIPLFTLRFDMGCKYLTADVPSNATHYTVSDRGDASQNNATQLLLQKASPARKFT